MRQYFWVPAWKVKNDFGCFRFFLCKTKFMSDVWKNAPLSKSSCFTEVVGGGGSAVVYPGQFMFAFRERAADSVDKDLWGWRIVGLIWLCWLRQSVFIQTGTPAAYITPRLPRASLPPSVAGWVAAAPWPRARRVGDKPPHEKIICTGYDVEPAKSLRIPCRYNFWFDWIFQ